ncbi:hypothetical protein PspLS_08029 [Pyricularia sp. CBS 133598]|nr:hypothetical protein PspLS_08029 [Pyricularia sp. CBS 133598]
MKNLVSLVCGLALFQILVAGGASISSEPFAQLLTTRQQLDVEQIRRELGSRVSNGTLIFGSDDEKYGNATGRYSNYSPPQIQVVVMPDQESDIPAIVRYCNRNSIPFLVNNRGHGFSKSLGTFNGVQINMARLRNITISPDGKSARLQGGTYVGQVVEYLWGHGLVTATGSCDCVGMLGPALGGGHGRQEGLYGMVIDNILHFNVVLANGAAITVSKDSHPDLFWAMRGAGHNFGIVTSFELKVYPRGPDTWHYHNYVWKGEKLEAVFDALNKFHGNGTTPVDMAVNYGFFVIDGSVTNTEPILSWTFAYRGSEQDAERHLAPFNAIEAVRSGWGDVPLPGISAFQGTDLSSPICRHGLGDRLSATAGLQVYNVTAERAIFDAFAARAVSDPALAAGMGILHEGYATAAVTAGAEDESAFPFRSDHHLMLASLVIDGEAAGPEGLEAGWEWVREVAAMWNEGQPGRKEHVYVNYANGFEPLEQLYGYEPWRLERLRDMKAVYDPHNRFRYYNPIVVG